MARDMTVRELRILLDGVPDHWPVMMMVSDDNSESWDCLPTSVSRSHVDPNMGCEGVWLYNITDPHDVRENTAVDWETEYGMPVRGEAEDSNDYALRVNKWELAHPTWHKVQAY